jgi:hypothetical protein
VRQSLVRFNHGAGLSLDVKTASLDTLETIKRKSSRVCPLICQHGFRADGERCVAIVCKAGTVLNDDNECEKKSPKREREAKKPKPDRSRHADDGEASAKPQASGQMVCGQGGCRPVRKGCRLERSVGGTPNGIAGYVSGGNIVEVCNQASDADLAARTRRTLVPRARFYENAGSAAACASICFRNAVLIRMTHRTPAT